MKIIEQRILSSPERPVSWRMQLHLGQPESPTGDITEWPSTVAVRGFLDARSAYFSRVQQGSKELVSQGLDFLAAASEILSYAGAYVDLLKDLSGKIEREACSLSATAGFSSPSTTSNSRGWSKRNHRHRFLRARATAITSLH